MKADHFDVVVVGSGFGGAVAALRLAEGGRKVLVLERGRPHPPGSFPTSPVGVRENFWSPRDGRFGWIELWSFARLGAVTASGLGGGSLTYANVMLRKPPETFDPEEKWPFGPEDLAPHYDRVEALQAPERYPYHDTPKTAAMREAAETLGWEYEHPLLGVKFGSRPGEPLDLPNLYGLPRTSCTLCANCVTGCNDGAKQTLDLTVISRAVEHGAEIRTGCEVRTLARDGDAWAVTYDQHLAARDERYAQLLDPVDAPVRTVYAPRVVLAAGTLGTTRLLLRNRASLPKLSPRLGTRFSGNGDLITWARNTRRDGELRYLQPAVGTVITTSLRPPDGRGSWIQDGGAPALSDWLWHTFDIPRNVWSMRRTIARRALGRMRGERDTALAGALAESFGDARSSAAMLPMLGLGRDMPTGVLRLRGETLDLRWSPKASGDYYPRLDADMAKVGEALGGRVPGGLFQRFRRYITVHPLGGCPAGETPAQGVVDGYGQVHGAPGLYVLDGAAMPAAVGPNPSFTIAAFADRGAAAILEEKGTP